MGSSAAGFGANAAGGAPGDGFSVAFAALGRPGGGHTPAGGVARTGSFASGASGAVGAGDAAAGLVEAAEVGAAGDHAGVAGEGVELAGARGLLRDVDDRGVVRGARGITARVAIELARRWRCQIELVGRSPLPPPEHPALIAAADAPALRKAILGAGLFGAAWLRWFAADTGAPPSRARTIVEWTGIFIAATALVPGLMLEDRIVELRVEWLGVVYRTPRPTTFGLVAFGYFLLAFGVVGVAHARRWRADRRARVAASLTLLLLLLAINDTWVTATGASWPLLTDTGVLVVIVPVASAAMVLSVLS